MSDLTNQLLDAMELIADRKVAAAKYDKTIQATIVSCVDAQTGKYKIKYQGNMFYAYSNDTSTTLNDGISVYVNVPENDFSKVKTIIGTVANKGNLSSSIVTENQRYEEIGIDCIVDNKLKQPIKINNNKVDADGYMLLYSKIGSEVYINEAISDVLQDEFALNVNIGSSFLLRGTFATSIENSIADKEYFIRIQCKCVTPEENEKPIYTEYVLSSKDMYGNPLMYSIPVTQTRYFRFSEELEEIYSISIGIKNFEDEDVLSVKELELIPCRFLEDNDITSRNLRIKRPWGTQFTDEKNTLLAEVELVENGKIVTLDAKRVSYLWFIEQPDAADSQDKAGTGWKLLSTTDGTKPQFTYSKDLFPQSSRRIKCVLNYQLEDEEGNNSSATYSAVSCFYNQHPKYEDKYFIIEKNNTKDGDFTAATSHYFSSGGESIYLKGNSIAADKKYTVVWVYQDVNGDYVIQDNITYTDETTGTLVTTNIIYVQAALLKNISREYVACFYDANGNFVGQQKFIIGFTNAENLDYDVNIINGNITYMYNEYGLAPTAVSSEAKVTIKEITLSLLDKKTSNLIFANTIAGTVRDNIIWYITANDKDRLVDFTDIEKDSSGKPLTTTIGGVEYVYAQGPTLSYTLKEKYNSKANSNDILVKIVYNNTTIWGTTHIQCWKVGDPGAVRGSYYIDILEVKPYEVNDTIEYKKLNEQNYFNAFRYYAGEKQFVSESIFLQTRIWDGQSWLDEDEFSVSFEILNKLPEIYSETEKNILNTLIKSCILCPNTKTIYEIEPKIINNLTYSDGKILLDGMSSLAQLVRVKITMTINNEEKNYYRIIPIAVIIEAKANAYDQGTENTDDDRHLQIVDNSGFKYVKFDSAGNNPVYDANSPFEIGFMDKKKTLFQDSSNNYDVKWECVNQAYTIVPQEKNNFIIDDLDLLKGEIVEKNGHINPYQFTVSVNISDYILYYAGVICKIRDNKIIAQTDVYESITGEQGILQKELKSLTEEYTKKSQTILANSALVEEEKQKALTDLQNEYYGEPDGLIYKINQRLNQLTSQTASTPGENLIGYIYFPIDIYKSYLDNAVVNGWDGHMLDMGIDANGHSYLMSNMIGAGSKDKNNRFCGVLMGQIVSTHGDNAAKSETGIMAYGAGDRTFFLDADTGIAMFGTGENSCIKIIPGGDAKIVGGGMTINFSPSNPSIKFTSGKFSVDSEGRLYAEEADINGHFTAGGFGEDTKESPYHPPVGSSVRIGPNRNEDGQVESMDFSFEARGFVSDKYGDYENVFDYTQIYANSFAFGRAAFATEPDDDGVYDYDLIEGILYNSGHLMIKGQIEADSGRIGGWHITNDAIVSSTRDLILYSNGQIIGLGGSDEDANFIDISNKTISWKNMGSTNYKDTETEDFSSWATQWKKDRENKTDTQTRASISTDNGCLSMNSSGAINIAGGASASISAGETSMGIYSNDQSNIYGMSVSAPSTVDGGAAGTVATMAAVMSTVEHQSKNNEGSYDTVENAKKFAGFIAINSTYDEDITNIKSDNTKKVKVTTDNDNTDNNNSDNQENEEDSSVKRGIHVLMRTNIPSDEMLDKNTKQPNDSSDGTQNDNKEEVIIRDSGFYVNEISSDKQRVEYLIMEEVKDKDGNGLGKYKPIPVSLSEAVQFWYEHKDEALGNIEYWEKEYSQKVIDEFNTFVSQKEQCIKNRKGKYSKDSKFNRLWKQYYISPTGYLAPTTYSVVGIPPIKAVMEKGEKEDKQGYFIREFYSEGILLNNKVGEKNAHKYGSDVHASWGMLEYFIETNEDGDVTTIYFPNGISMGLEGFEKILAPNCPYNQKQQDKEK